MVWDPNAGAVAAISDEAGQLELLAAGGARQPSPDHESRVAANEAAGGWGPESGARVRTLTARIARLGWVSSVSPVAAAVAVLIGAADLVLAATSVVNVVTGHRSAAGLDVTILLAMFVPTVWAAWTLSRLVEHHRGHAYRSERDLLLRARGCGDPACPHCG